MLVTIVYFYNFVIFILFSRYPHGRKLFILIHTKEKVKTHTVVKI